MKWQSIKFAILAAVSLLMMTTSLAAWQQQPCDWGCQPTQCATCCPCGSLCLEGDLLYWKARGSNIVYLADFDHLGFPDEAGFNTFRFVTRYKSLDYDRDVGFRVGARYDFACSCWNAAFLWTHLKTEAKGKTSPYKRAFDFDFFATFYDVEAHYNLDLNYWDLEFARNFCPCKCLNIRFFLGVRGANVDQKYKSFSTYEVVGTLINGQSAQLSLAKQIAAFSDRELEIREKYKFHGAGPRIGVDFDADLLCGIGLYGQAAVSGLVGYSKREVDHCYTDKFIDPFAVSGGSNNAQRQCAGIFVFQDIEEQNQKLQANRAMTDFALGLRYMPGMFCCCQSLTLRFGWEHHTLFGQKYAYFGKDVLPTTSFVSSSASDTDFSPPEVLKNCNSTLAVHGFVFSAELCF